MADVWTKWDEDIGGPGTETLWDDGIDGPGTSTRWDLISDTLGRTIRVVWGAMGYAVSWINPRTAVKW